MSMRKRTTETEFACYIRNVTPATLALSVPLGRAEREPRMHDEAYPMLKDRVRRQVAAPIDETDAHIAAAMPGDLLRERLRQRRQVLCEGFCEREGMLAIGLHDEARGTRSYRIASSLGHSSQID